MLAFLRNGCNLKSSGSDERHKGAAKKRCVRVVFHKLFKITMTKKEKGTHTEHFVEIANIFKSGTVGGRLFQKIHALGDLLINVFSIKQGGMHGLDRGLGLSLIG